jgi:hypothetical protein
MRNRRTTIVGLTLVLSLVSLSFKCNSTGPTGQPEPLRNAASAADAVAKSIGEMIKLKRDLANQHKITSAEELKLTQALLRINTADKALVKRLKSMNSMPDASGRAQLLSMFGEVTSALSDLNNNGVLGIQNQDARNQLTTIINSINASIQIIQAFVQSAATPTPTP